MRKNTVLLCVRVLPMRPFLKLFYSMIVLKTYEMTTHNRFYELRVSETFALALFAGDRLTRRVLHHWHKRKNICLRLKPYAWQLRAHFLQLVRSLQVNQQDLQANLSKYARCSTLDFLSWKAFRNCLYSSCFGLVSIMLMTYAQLWTKIIYQILLLQQTVNRFQKQILKFILVLTRLSLCQILFWLTVDQQGRKRL